MGEHQSLQALYNSQQAKLKAMERDLTQLVGSLQHIRVQSFYGAN